MIRFLIRRIILGLITLWVIVSLVFFLYYARPGVRSGPGARGEGR